MVIELTAEQEEALAGLARDRSLTADELARDAVVRLVEAHTEHLAAIDRARADIAAGRTIAHDDVVRRLKERMGW